MKACMHCADSVCVDEWVHMCSHVRACVWDVGACMCVWCGYVYVCRVWVHVCGVWVHVCRVWVHVCGVCVCGWVCGCVWCVYVCVGVGVRARVDEGKSGIL